jgi:hypothetical protein
MKSLNIYTLLTVVAFMCSSGCIGGQNKISIEPITVLDTVLTKHFNGKVYKDKMVYYKVIGYKDNEESLKAIEDFIKKNHVAEVNKYTNYTISFYDPPKDESDKVELKNHPDRYYNQDNVIYDFTWLNGKFLSKTKYKDGEIVGEKNKVIIKDVPIPKDEH